MDSAVFTKLVTNLPSDPELAFIELAQRAVILSNEFSDYNSLEVRELVTVVERFASKFKIDFAGKNDDESWQDQLNYLSTFVAGRIEETHRLRIAESMVDNFVEDFSNKISNTTNFGEAVLEDAEKAEIRAKLNDIRNKIDKSNLSSSKKNALFARINNLNIELDRHGTRTDSFMGFALDISILGKPMHKNIKPIVEDVKDILQIIYIGRAKTEGVSLPAPEDLPKLPGPLE